MEGSWSPQTEGLGARIQSLEARTEPDGFRSVRVRKTRGPFDRSARLARPPHYRKPDVPPGGYRRIDNERKRTLSERFDSPRSPEVDTSLIMDWLVVRILPTPPRSLAIAEISRRLANSPPIGGVACEPRVSTDGEFAAERSFPRFVSGLEIPFPGNRTRATPLLRGLKRPVGQTVGLSSACPLAWAGGT